jgi:hypothetical protein
MLRTQYMKFQRGHQKFVICEVDDLGGESFSERDVAAGESTGHSFTPSAEEYSTAQQLLQLAAGGGERLCRRITYDGREDLTIDWAP